MWLNIEKFLFNEKGGKVNFCVAHFMNEWCENIPKIMRIEGWKIKSFTLELEGSLNPSSNPINPKIKFNKQYYKLRRSGREKFLNGTWYPGESSCKKFLQLIIIKHIFYFNSKPARL